MSRMILYRIPRNDNYFISSVAEKFYLSRSAKGSEIVEAFKTAADFERMRGEQKEKWIVSDEAKSHPQRNLVGAVVRRHIYVKTHKFFFGLFGRDWEGWKPCDETIRLVLVDRDSVYSDIGLEVSDHDFPDEGGWMSAYANIDWFEFELRKILDEMNNILMRSKIA